MDRAKYNSIIFSKSEGLKTWKMIALFMIASNLILALFVFSVDLNVKTILVPMGLKKDVWIKGERISNSYIEEIGSEFFNYLLNFNKENALFRFKKVLKHVDPKYYEVLKSKLYTDFERIQRNDISSTFYPLKLKARLVKEKSNEYLVTVQGQKLGLVGSRVINDQLKVYQLILSYKNNNLSIKSYGELSKSEMDYE